MYNLKQYLDIASYNCYDYNHGIKKVYFNALKFLIVIVWITLFVSYLGLTIALGSLLCVIVIIPGVLIYFVVLIMLVITWRRKNMV